MQKLFESKFWKTCGIGLMFVAFGIVALICSLIARYFWNKDIEEQKELLAEQEELMEYQNQNQQEQEEILEQTSIAEHQEITGISMTRKSDDDETVSQIFNYACTWSGASSYKNSRDKLLEEYPWLEEEDNDFLTNFIPPVEELIIYDSDGNEIANELDTGANISFMYIDSQVIDITDNIYSYLTEVIVQSKGLSGGTSDGKVLATYTTDINGHVQNLKAYNVY